MKIQKAINNLAGAKKLVSNVRAVTRDRKLYSEIDKIEWALRELINKYDSLGQETLKD